MSQRLRGHLMRQARDNIGQRDAAHRPEHVDDGNVAIRRRPRQGHLSVQHGSAAYPAGRPGGTARPRHGTSISRLIASTCAKSLPVQAAKSRQGFERGLAVICMGG